MSAFPYSIFTVVAGPFDWPLMVIVLGTMIIAIVANILAVVEWLRRQP
jgi:hypothetical protein